MSSPLPINQIICGDAYEVLRTFPKDCVDCVVTSPPYWQLRDYSVSGQFGREATFAEYINNLCKVFDEAFRVLKSNGTCWVNLGDKYASGHCRKDNWKTRKGIPLNKCLLQLPSRLAIAMTDRGWILRNEIIWHKPNASPSSVKDRFTVDFEKLFFFVKSKQYYFDQDSVREPYKQLPIERLKRGVSNRHKNLRIPGQTVQGMHKARLRGEGVRINSLGRNRRCVWTIPTRPFKEAHFAVYPKALIEMPIIAGCPKSGIVLDPFVGSGTTAVEAKRLGRCFIGLELNPRYAEIAARRLAKN